jgi:hypothetical protein
LFDLGLAPAGGVGAPSDACPFAGADAGERAGAGPASGADEDVDTDPDPDADPDPDPDPDAGADVDSGDDPKLRKIGGRKLADLSVLHPLFATAAASAAARTMSWVTDAGMKAIYYM